MFVIETFVNWSVAKAFQISASQYSVESRGKGLSEAYIVNNSATSTMDDPTSATAVGEPVKNEDVKRTFVKAEIFQYQNISNQTDFNHKKKLRMTYCYITRTPWHRRVSGRIYLTTRKRIRRRTVRLPFGMGRVPSVATWVIAKTEGGEIVAAVLNTSKHSWNRSEIVLNPHYTFQ